MTQLNDKRIKWLAKTGPYADSQYTEQMGRLEHEHDKILIAVAFSSHLRMHIHQYTDSQAIPDMIE